MKALAAFALLLGVPASGALPSPDIERLPNGLTVAWFVDDRLPLVDVALLVRAGRRLDPAGGSGTAEILAAVVDEGAGARDAATFARAVESLGAIRYVSADDDSMTLGIHGLSGDAPVLIGLLADMTLRPALPMRAVAWERERIAETLARVRSDSESAVAIAFGRLMSAGTPYFRGSLQSVEELKGVTREQVAAFHARYFVPKDAVLMVAGNVDRAAFSPKVAEAFGAWGSAGARGPGVAAPPEPRAADSPSSREVTVVHYSGEEQAHARIGYRLPPIGSADTSALLVANALLGEYFKSRLNRVVRDSLGLTYAIRSSMSYNQDLGIFTVGSSTRGRLAGKLLEKSIEVVESLKKDPPSEEELRQAKDFLIGAFPVRTAGLAAAASRWLAGQVFRLGPEYHNGYVEQVERITARDVVRVAAAYLDRSKARIAVSGDAELLAKGFAASGFRIFTRVSGEELLRGQAPPSGKSPGKKPRTRS